MLELLLNTLKDFDGAEYLIKESKTRRIENYNIKKQSEMFREVEVTELFLTLYVTFSEESGGGEPVKYRGSYNTVIHPGTSADELRKIIKHGLFAARFVKNAWFPLVSPCAADDKTGNAAGGAGSNATGSTTCCSGSNTASSTADDIKLLAAIQTAFYANDTHAEGRLSYSEFFLTRSDVRIINSSGVDVKYSASGVYAETAVHWRSEKNGEIEISEMFRFNLPANVNVACDMLKERIGQLFTVAEKKSAAQPTPQVGDINILLSGACLAEFFSYYHSCANTQMIYQHLSTFKDGEQIQTGDGSGCEGSGCEGCGCDRLTLTLDPLMEGSDSSYPYDNDGLRVYPETIIKDGKLLKYWGNTRFAAYLGIQPTGSISNYHITGGIYKAEDLRKEPYLELISFSAFQINPVTGDFGSEIRLGFYFDGEKTVAVTGGSITGNIAGVQNNMRMSVEEKQYNNYRGPATICIRGASISSVV